MQQRYSCQPNNYLEKKNSYFNKQKKIIISKIINYNKNQFIGFTLLHAVFVVVPLVDAHLYFREHNRANR